MIIFIALAIITFAVLTFGYILLATVEEYKDIVDKQEGRK